MEQKLFGAICLLKCTPGMKLIRKSVIGQRSACLKILGRNERHQGHGIAQWRKTQFLIHYSQQNQIWAKYNWEPQVHLDWLSMNFC